MSWDAVRGRTAVGCAPDVLERLRRKDSLPSHLGDVVIPVLVMVVVVVMVVIFKAGPRDSHHMVIPMARVIVIFGVIVVVVCILEESPVGVPLVAIMAGVAIMAVFRGLTTSRLAAQTHTVT